MYAVTSSPTVSSRIKKKGWVVGSLKHCHLFVKSTGRKIWSSMASASEIAAKLNLVAHPEGGFYNETFRDASVFLSKSQLPPESCFKQVLELDEIGQIKLTCLGPDLLDNQQVQYTVPPNVWFGAFPTKDFHISTDGAVTKTESRDAESHYSLVGCTCAPAFQFQDFELAKRSELVTCFPNHEHLISLLTYPD